MNLGHCAKAGCMSDHNKLKELLRITVQGSALDRAGHCGVRGNPECMFRVNERGLFDRRTIVRALTAAMVGGPSLCLRPLRQNRLQLPRGR